jgi:hypothetical protein
LPWVPRRLGDCPLATIDHGRSEAADGSPVLGFGSDVIGAKDQVQACFRHINPQICGRRALGYGFDNCNEMFAVSEDVRLKVSRKVRSRRAISEKLLCPRVTR